MKETKKVKKKEWRKEKMRKEQVKGKNQEIGAIMVCSDRQC